jgi:thiol-disulfide isomerase/thioredoxin
MMERVLIALLLGLIAVNGSASTILRYDVENDTSEKVDLATFTGKPLIVIYIASWCGKCLYELPSAARMAKEYAKNVKVIMVSIDKDAAKLAPKLEASGINATKIYHDPRKILAFEYGLRGIPALIAFDKKGKLYEKYEGALDWDNPENREFVDNLIEGDAKVAVSR